MYASSQGPGESQPLLLADAISIKLLCTNFLPIGVSQNQHNPQIEYLIKLQLEAEMEQYGGFANHDFPYTCIFCIDLPMVLDRLNE